MKRYIILSLFLALALTNLQAQQLQTSSLYDLQGVLHNPSMAGINNMVGVTYRSQWTGISGSPRTGTVFGSFKLPEQKIGLGGYIYSDKTGPTSRTGIQLAFAKHIETANGTFSLGLEARGQQFSLNREKLSQSIAGDPAMGAGDNRFKFDAGFGVSYTNKKFQIGASVSQLVQSKLDFYTGNLSTTEQARLYRHYYLHGSYQWTVDEATVITPNFLMIYLPNAPLEFQGGFRVEHNNIFWWGVALRARQSWMLSAGAHITKKFTLGYAFDIYKTPISSFQGGANAHELMLRYNIIK